MRRGSWVVAAKGCPLSQVEKPFSLRGRAVTAKERDVVREIEVTS